MSARVGDQFGPYLFLHKIAQGGMGEVFLARKQGAEGFSRHVVVKRMLSHLADRADFLEMFFAEARLASRLHHERIAQVHDAGRIGDEFYLEMEFVAGVDLKAVLERSVQRGLPIPFAVTCELIAQAAEGLAYAHRATDHDGQPLKLVHRDINPANLLVAWSGDVKVIDLGIAKSELHHGKTETGLLKGKFLYMSPEQSEGKPLTGATDLFSLGIVLYEALLGRHPFDRGSLARTLAAIQTDSMPTIVDPLLFPLEGILQRVLHKDPEARYRDGDVLAADLRAVLSELPEARPAAVVMGDLFAEEMAYISDVLALEEPAEIKRLDRLTNPPVDVLPTLPDGMPKPEGWTDFWKDDGDSMTATPAVTPTEKTRQPSTKTIFVRQALSRSLQLWVLVLLAVLTVLYMGLRRDAPDAAPPSVPQPVETRPAQVPVKVAPEAVDAGASDVRVPRPDAGASQAKPKPVIREQPRPKPKPVKAPAPRLLLKAAGERLKVTGLGREDQKRSSGTFSARGDGLTVRIQWKRRAEGGMALAMKAMPWAIVYRGTGPALGRSPPIRRIVINPGRPEVLRFRHPAFGDFTLHLRLK